jgi:hypothetical protein
MLNEERDWALKLRYQRRIQQEAQEERERQAALALVRNANLEATQENRVEVMDRVSRRLESDDEFYWRYHERER